MKKLMSALLALLLCLSMSLAGAEGGPEPPAQSEAQPAPAEPAPEAPPEEAADPTEAPITSETDDPAGAPTEAPEGGEPTPGASDAPGDAPTLEPPADPTAGPTDAPTPPPQGPQGEGYVLGPEGRLWGRLEELLLLEGERTIYISAQSPVTIAGFELALLRGARLLPDPEVFREPGAAYLVTLRSGEDEITPEDIEAATDEVVDLTIFVEKKPEPTATPGAADVRIRVEPRGFAGDGIWQCEIPEFQLSGIPAGSAGYCYVAIVYDERFIPLSGDSYLPMEEGVYALRFAILDPQGDIVNGASERYEPWLDYTPPMLNIEISPTQDYTMTLSASDALSGVVGLSLDGGQSWTSAELGEGLSVVHTEPDAKVFPAGSIRIRDAAGNESWNTEDVALDRAPTMSWGGGGGEPSATEAPHASGDGDDAPYAAYDLALPEGAVDVLTLGGEAIDLGLEIEPDGAPAPAPAQFTAELTAWAANPAPAHAEEAPAAKDTLVIRAADGRAGSAYACRWRVNGAVLRKLYNSDIRYLVLAAGDAALSLPTVGFTAGTRYAELKMQGVSTAEFEYSITMRIDPESPRAPAPDGWNLTRDCAVEIQAEVGGERFTLLDRASTPEMYPVDVYCGPADLTDYPYGAYPRAEMEG